jgi:hypothetical protein
MFSLVLYVSVPVLLFRIPTVFDLLPIESVRFRIYCYPASSFSFLFPTFPNSISFPYSNVKVKTILGLSRPSSTAFNLNGETRGDPWTGRSCPPHGSAFLGSESHRPVIDYCTNEVETDVDFRYNSVLLFPVG